LEVLKGAEQELEAPLNAALTQLNRNHDTPPCNQLNAFLNQVNAKETSGQLTTLQGTDLTQQAVSIQRAIGCTNLRSMVGFPIVTTATHALGQQLTNTSNYN
jgi:hypothetical protein